MTMKKMMKMRQSKRKKENNFYFIYWECNLQFVRDGKGSF